MTVSTTTNKIVLTANGLSNTFTFPFAVRFNGATDIQVFQTDTSGNITQLTYGTQYTVVLNAVIAPNPTPVGGTVTITAIPALNTLVTILRTEAETQATSLANQGTLYQPAIEAMSDYVTMLTQQIAELQGRAISVAVSDNAPTNLPPAAQRANLALMFDSNGNPIAAAPGGANAPVSSAMAPVVNAASIAAAVALLGLTGVAPEPSGVVKAYAGSAAPSGYLLCSGTAVSRTTFAALFAVISTTYGVGDGSTTFNLPDLRGRVPAGLDNMGGTTAGRLTSNTITGGATTLGNSNGNTGIEQNILAIGQLPAHQHPVFLKDNQHSHDMGGAPNTAGASAVSFASNSGGSTISGASQVANKNNSSNITIGSVNGTANDNQTANTGSGNPVNNVQPTIILNWIIKT